jgi:Acetyltransferase (GNAT) domain
LPVAALGVAVISSTSMNLSPEMTERPAELIKVEPYDATLAQEWKSFLATSDNGTLFHDLDFLAYHPQGRFETHHLLFSRAGERVALLPAALVAEEDGRPWLKSPYGASIGGFVLPPSQSPLVTLELCASLKDHARSLGCGGVEMRIPPAVYHRACGETQSFALAAAGFTLSQRWFCPIISLAATSEAEAGTIASKRYRQYVRAALRQGAQVSATGPERLDELYVVLEANRAKYQVKPTHSLDELKWLVDTLPERIRLFICTLSGPVIGAAVMFDVTERVTCCFYLCHDERFDEYRAPAVLISHLMQEYARRGFHYLDMGPSGNIDLSSGRRTLNSGGINFKQQLGGVGYCRDTWRSTIEV